VAWAVTFVPAILAALTAFWNTREPGFLDMDGNGSKKSRRSRKRATA